MDKLYLQQMLENQRLILVMLKALMEWQQPSWIPQKMRQRINDAVEASGVYAEILAGDQDG